jgi:protein ImuA
LDFIVVAMPHMLPSPLSSSSLSEASVAARSRSSIGFGGTLREANGIAEERWGNTDHLEGLRAAIRVIERKAVAPLRLQRCPFDEWSLGAAQLDAVLAGVLDPAAVHEIKPALAASEVADWSAVWAAARGFALALAVRRLHGRQRDGPHTGLVLWCQSRAHAVEFGRPYGPGLRALGLEPDRLLLVEPARAADVPWALEEALASGNLALVAGQLDEIALTPARRLALAAARTGTPCLLLTDPRAAAAAATATRWRVAPASSASHPLDPDAPGSARFELALERCRGRPPLADDLSLMLEWCDAAYRFRLAPVVADRAHAPRRSGPLSQAGPSGLVQPGLKPAGRSSFHRLRAVR